jgi:excisionase family DNA binding protein
MRFVKLFFAYPNSKKGGDKMQNLYTVEQVAEKFEVHPETVRKLARAGELSGKKIGNSWRFSDEDLSKFIESLEVNKPN